MRRDQRERALARVAERCERRARLTGEDGLREVRLPWRLGPHSRRSARHAAAPRRSRRSDRGLAAGARSSPRGRASRARSRAARSRRRSRPSRAPGAGARAPIQRAPSTRSMWPCENSATAAAGRGDAARRARGRRARRLRRRSRRPGSRRATGPSPAAAARISRGRQALVVAVVPLAQVLGRTSARLAQPAQLARFARAPQRADEHELEAPAREPRRERARGLRARASVRGMSVRPVWRPLRLHSVSAWRTSTTSRAPGGCAHAGGPGGAAASSTITVRRSRAQQARRHVPASGSPSIALTASALPAPVASSRQLRAARSTPSAQRDPLGRRLGRVVHAEADACCGRRRAPARRGTATRRGRPGRSRARPDRARGRRVRVRRVTASARSSRAYLARALARGRARRACGAPPRRAMPAGSSSVSATMR